jgi:four helix bundle protein
MRKHNYKELIVWQKARLLFKQTYLVTRQLPDDERYGLISQMRRAAVSVSSNIAEGSGRTTDRQFAIFLGNALGSLLELESQYLLCEDVELLDGNEIDTTYELIGEITRMLESLIFKFEKV